MVPPKFRPRTTVRVVYQNSQPDCFLRWHKLQRKASTLKSSVEQLGTFKEINWYGHLWVESDQIATVFKGVDKFPTMSPNLQLKKLVPQSMEVRRHRSSAGQSQSCNS